MKSLNIAILLFSLVIIGACKHEPVFFDDEPIIDPTDTTGNGDTTIVTPPDTTIITPPDTTTMGTPCEEGVIYFEQDVLPIFLSSCAYTGCHDAATARDGVILNSYSNVINTADVEAYDLDAGKLYEAITDSDWDDRMPPPPNSGLTAGQVNIIANWINQGAQNLTCDDNATGCPTDNVSFSATVLPIMQNNCVGCHGGAAPAAGIALNTYNGVQTVALNGRLYGSISHASGYTPMPFNGNQLNDCFIDQIKSWIDAGAVNN